MGDPRSARGTSGSNRLRFDSFVWDGGGVGTGGVFGTSNRCVICYGPWVEPVKVRASGLSVGVVC